MQEEYQLLRMFPDTMNAGIVIASPPCGTDENYLLRWHPACIAAIP